MRKFVEAWIVFAIVLSAPAWAQPSGGTLEVHVTDDSGGVIPGADIALIGPQGLAGTAAADGQGQHAFAGLPAGSYQVRVSWPGFAPAESALRPVAAERPAVVHVSLHLQVSEEHITVQAEAGGELSVDPAANAGALILRGVDLDSLPDDPDDLAADLKALAGPSAGLGDAQLFIDGFSGGRLPSKESIREIRINQNPFSAEYDRVGFGRIEIFTKPGSDQFHGTGFFKYSDATLNSRNPFAPLKPPYQSEQFGGNVGGPLSKRASVFLDFERRAIDDNAVINATALDSAFQIVPVRQVLQAPQQHSNLSARVDYQLTQKNTLVGRVNWWDSGYDNSGVGAFSLASRAYHKANAGYSLQLTETAVLSPVAINETRFQYTRESLDLTSGNVSPSLVVADAFNAGGPPEINGTNLQNRFELQNSTSLTLGAHLVKFGARLRGVTLTDSSQKYFSGQFVFSGGTGPELDANNQVVLDASGNPVIISLTSIERYRRTLLFESLGLSPADIHSLGGGPNQFQIVGGQPVVALGQMDAGLYLQDDWRARPNLTLSAGLRWEAQTHLRDWRDFGPRLGFAWAPGRAKHAKTVIRGGVGIFYDRFGENLVLDALRYAGTDRQQYIIHAPDFFPTVPSLADLAANGALPTVRQIQSGLRAPYLIEGALGIERQLPLKLVLAVNYINTHGLHLLRSRNINAPINQVTPFDSGNIYLYESSGILNQNQVITSVNRRFSAGLSVFGYYAYGRAFSNTDGPGTFPLNQYDTRPDYGRAATDIRHRGVLGASLAGPIGFRLSPFLLARSGAPFDITTGLDNNGDSLYTDRPAFASDPRAAGAISTRFGLFNVNPGPGDRIIPRNYGQGPGYFTLNCRLSRTFGFGGEKQAGKRSSGKAKKSGGAAAAEEIGLHSILKDGSSGQRYNLTFAVQVRNIFNQANPGTPVGNLSSSLFGTSTWLASSSGADSIAAGDNRRIQLQMKFTF